MSIHLDRKPYWTDRQTNGTVRLNWLNNIMLAQ